GAVQARIAKIDQGVDIAVGHGIDTAASSAVPAVGSAFGNEFLAAKARRAIAAFAGNDFAGCLVYEFHGSVRYKEKGAQHCCAWPAEVGTRAFATVLCTAMHS